MDEKVVFEVINMETDTVTRRIKTTEAEAAKVELDLLSKYDGDKYFIRDKRDD